VFNIPSFQSDQHGMLQDCAMLNAVGLPYLRTSTTEEPSSRFYFKFYSIYISLSVKPAAKWEADCSPPSSVEVKNV
jgi:hypothetical protein